MGRLFAFWDEIPAQRKKRIALFVLAIAIVGATVWAARSVLGLYFVGLVLAYLLSPIVDAIQRGIEWFADKIRFGFLRRMARSLGIVIAYILLIAVIAGFFALVVPLVAREAQQLWEARDSIYVEISDWVEGALAQYELLPDRVRQQIDDALRNLSASVTQVLQQAVQSTVVAITYTFSIVLGITIVPFWTYFLLRDYDQIRDSVTRSLPRSVRRDIRSVSKLLDRTVGGYLRGELVLMIVVGVLQTIAMAVLGVPYALVLGVIAGVLEVIPNIGPTVAAIPAVLVALTKSPLLALAAAVAAKLVQSVENSLIVPHVLGSSVGLHPVVMMVMLVVGAEIAGLPGLILAPILAAVVRDVYRYFALRFADVPYSPEEALQAVVEGATFSLDL